MGVCTVVKNTPHYILWSAAFQWEEIGQRPGKSSAMYILAWCTTELWFHWFSRNIQGLSNRTEKVFLFHDSGNIWHSFFFLRLSVFCVVREMVFLKPTRTSGVQISFSKRRMHRIHHWILEPVVTALQICKFPWHSFIHLVMTGLSE